MASLKKSRLSQTKWNLCIWSYVACLKKLSVSSNKDFSLLNTAIPDKVSEAASTSSLVIVLCQLCDSGGLEFSILIREVLFVPQVLTMVASVNSSKMPSSPFFRTLMLDGDGFNLISEMANHRCSYHTAWIWTVHNAALHGAVDCLNAVFC